MWVIEGSCRAEKLLFLSFAAIVHISRLQLSSNLLVKASSLVDPAHVVAYPFTYDMICGLMSVTRAGARYG